MTSPTADQYQRAIDLLDDDNFWGRYVDTIEAGVDRADEPARALAPKSSTETADAQPKLAQPSVAEPSVAEPRVVEPGDAQPSVAEPSLSQPSDAQPSVGQPSVAEPSLSQPSDAQPRVVEPSDARPSVAQPSVAQPSLSQPRVVALAGRGHQDQSPATSERRSRFQRLALAAAAGIVILAGVAVFQSRDTEQPIDVFADGGATVLPEVDTTLDPEPGSNLAPIVPTPDPSTLTPPLSTPDPTSEPEPTPQPTAPVEPESPAPDADATATASESSETDATDGQDESEQVIDPNTDLSISASSPLGQVLASINETRSSQGLPGLRYSPALAAVAHDQAWSLADYQDTILGRESAFTLERVIANQDDPARESAWTTAIRFGSVNVEQQLPSGRLDWDQHLARGGGVLDALRSDDARALQLGDFTHVGIASAGGKYAGANVFVFASYPEDTIVEPAISVRTDGGCFATDDMANPSTGLPLSNLLTLGLAQIDLPANRVDLRFCAGQVVGTLETTDLDSRYRVSLIRKATGTVAGTFVCSAWNICEATVDLDSEIGPFDLVLSRLTPGEGTFQLGQISARFPSTNGAQTAVVSVGGRSVEIESAEAQLFSDRLQQTGGGWLLETNDN